MNKYKYYAFISYKREDESWAKWLQEKMEYYRLPTANEINGEEYIRPIFRDITDLRPGILSERIKDALDNSKYLIAICSPLYSKSPWCDAEIKRFIETGKTKQIIPFIIDGTPYSKDTECFPPSLRELRGTNNELLAADIRPISREFAFVQIVATMLDISVDSLWKRYLRKEEEEKRRIKEQNDHLLKLQSRITSEKARELLDKYPYNESKAARIVLEVLPHNIDYPERPWVPEGEYVLRRASKNRQSTIEINDKGGIICYSEKYCVCQGKRGPIDTNNKLYHDFSIRLYNDKGLNIFDINYNTHVIDASISSDNKYLALATYESIILIDIDKKKEILNVKCNSNTSKILKISNDNSKIVCASGETLVILNIASGIKTERTIHDKKIVSLNFCFDNNHLITTSLDKSTKILDINTMNCDLCINHDAMAMYSTISNINNTILTALDKKEDRIIIKEHSITTGREMSCLTMRGTFTTNMHFCENLGILIIEDLSNIYLVDYKSGIIIDEFYDSRLLQFNDNKKEMSLIKNGIKIERYLLLSQKDLLDIATKTFGSYPLTEEDKRMYYIL